MILFFPPLYFETYSTTFIVLALFSAMMSGFLAYCFFNSKKRLSNFEYGFFWRSDVLGYVT
mgnify:CR=1 FL=1